MSTPLEGTEPKGLTPDHMKVYALSGWSLVAETPSVYSKTGNTLTQTLVPFKTPCLYTVQPHHLPASIRVWST